MMENYHVLTCKTCGTDLTNPLKPITDVAEMEEIFHLEWDQHVVPFGRFIVLTGVLRAALDKRCEDWRATDDIVMNYEDLLRVVRQTPHRKRLVGCCSMPGHNGPNYVCKCGTHIGTQHSDCCEYHIFEPMAEDTAWKTIRKETL